MPTLFDLTATEWQSSLVNLVITSLAFVFAYVMGLNLRNIPGLSNIENLKPPKWILPVFTFGSIFAVSFALTATLYLKLAKIDPDLHEFNKTYRTSSKILFDGKPMHSNNVDFIIKNYSRLDHLQIFLNNRLIFGDHWNCKAKYQCRREKTYPIPKFPQNIANRRFPIDQSYSIPIQIGPDNFRDTFTPNDLLVVGKNQIDITLAQSGLTGKGGDYCNFEFDIVFNPKSANERIVPIEISKDGFKEIRSKSFEYCHSTNRSEKCDKFDDYKICDRKTLIFFRK